jgi:DNA-binding XRE family transcriptional regulator
VELQRLQTTWETQSPNIEAVVEQMFFSLANTLERVVPSETSPEEKDTIGHFLKILQTLARYLRQTRDKLQWFHKYGRLLMDLVQVVATPLATDEREKELLNVDNAALYHKLREALATKHFQRSEGERWPAADLATEKKTVRATAQLRPHPKDVEPILTNSELDTWQERMAQHVLAMNDLTADVLDVISAVWLQQAQHHEAMANVTADDFLRLRGLQAKKSGTGRRGGYWDEQRQEISRQISILANLWITVAEMEVTEEVEGKKGRYRKRTKWRGASKAVVVSSIFGPVTEDDTMEPYIWRVRPGDVFAKFLFGPGRQTALLSQKALEYDPYRQKWEKRLARYLAWQWRNRQGKGTYLQSFSVETLLKAISVTVDENNPLKTKERLEKALDNLHRDHVTAGWQYERAYEELVGQKGWWKAWLQWKILIEPPQTIMDHYATIKNAEVKLPKALLGEQDTGETMKEKIRQTRKARRLTQLQAAEKLEISANYLAMIERGIKTPSEQLKRKIIKWMETS